MESLIKKGQSEISTLERLWRKVTSSFISFDEDMEAISRKLSCVVFGAFFLFGVCGFYLVSQSSNHERGSDTWLSLVLAGSAAGCWGFLFALPTLCYVLYTKTASATLTSVFMWATFALAMIADTTVTFLPAPTILVSVCALCINSGIASGNLLALLIICYVEFGDIRDAFRLPLRMPGAYEGLGGERYAFSLASVLCVIIVVLLTNVARWEQRKMLETAKLNEVLAQTIARHILSYDCDNVTKTLDVAAADVVINEETGETEPSRVSKDLISSFRQINQNLEQWKPLLPEWAIARCQKANHGSSSTSSDDDDDAQSINLYGSKGDDDDDEAGDEGKVKDRHVIDMSLHSPSSSANNNNHDDRNNKRSNLFESSRASDAVSDGTRHSSASTNRTGHSNRPHYMQHDRRSWEAGDNNDTSDDFDGSDRKKKSNNKNSTQNVPATSILKGNFTERVIVCRLNLSKITAFVISAFSQQNRHSKRFLAQTSARFNKVIELLLDTASSYSATVHAIYSDNIFLSWNATTRISSSDGKAVKFLTTLEKSLRAELAGLVPEVERENALVAAANTKNNINNNNNNNNAAGVVGKKRNKNMMQGSRSSSAIGLPEANSAGESGGVAGISLGQISGNLSTLNNNSVISVKKELASTTPQETTPAAAADTTTVLTTTVTSPLQQMLDDTNHRLITGAAVHGSCFAQVAGSLKKQQFVLSSFSNLDTLEQACLVGDRCEFVAVCRTIQQNTQHEMEFRGCGVVLPKQHRDLIHHHVMKFSSEVEAELVSQKQALEDLKHSQNRNSINNNNNNNDTGASNYHQHQSNQRRDSHSRNGDIIMDGNLCNIMNVPTQQQQQPQHTLSPQGNEESEIVSASESESVAAARDNVSGASVVSSTSQQQHKSNIQKQQARGGIFTTNPDPFPTAMKMLLPTLPTSLSPLYELVGLSNTKKAAGGGDDEWLYLIGDGNNNNDNNENNTIGDVSLNLQNGSNSKMMTGSAKRTSMSSSIKAVNKALNEATMALQKGDVQLAKTILDKFDFAVVEEQTKLESFSIMKGYVYVLSEMFAS